MRAPQASLATLDVLPAKGRAAQREAVPDGVAPPAPPAADPAMVRLPPPGIGGVSTNLRLPADLHHSVKLTALEEGVSLNALILGFIRDGLARRNAG